MQTLDRRELLSGAMAGAVVAGTTVAAEMPPEEPQPRRLIDTNVSLFQWPSRRLPLDETVDLVQKLHSRSLGTELSKALNPDISERDREQIFGEHLRRLLSPILARKGLPIR